jgi:hypothetical protein
VVEPVRLARLQDADDHDDVRSSLTTTHRPVALATPTIVRHGTAPSVAVHCHFSCDNAPMRELGAI